MKEFQREKGVTYLFIAHDLSIVRLFSDRIGVIYKGRIVEVADAEELFDYPLHPYTHSLISAIPIPHPQLEKNKVLYTYDPSVHDYSEDEPEFVNIGHDHWVYGNKKEIEEYRAIRESGEPIKAITISKSGKGLESEVEHQIQLDKAEEEFLKAPVGDNGHVLYGVLGFFLPIIGIILAQVFKKKYYFRNFKMLKKWSIYGFIFWAVIVALFFILLLMVII